MNQPSAEGTGRIVPVNDLVRTEPITRNYPTPERALAVGAHPDDIEFGCGATLAKWAAGGCEIHHLILTDGAKGTWDPTQDPASLVALRQEEQRAAAAELGGGNVGFLGWPDGELRNGIREQWEVSRWIREIRPDVVLGHDPWRPYQLHPDHRNAGFILTDALMAARDPLFFTDQNLANFRPTALLLWEAGVANHVEDVDGFGATKVRALLAHRSQHRNTMGLADAEDTPDEAALAAFEARVHTQLIEHGDVGAFGFGEAFHLMTNL
jgi:LmbE family N-acetylglucosaminyl deacetylase